MPCQENTVSEVIPGIVQCFIQPQLDLDFLLDFLPDFFNFLILTVTILVLFYYWRKNPLVAKPSGKTFIASLILFMLEACLNAIGELVWFTPAAFVLYRYLRFTLLVSGQVLLSVSLYRVFKHSDRLFGLPRRNKSS